MKTSFIISFVAMAFALAITAPLSASAKPNILFIIADDLDPRLGCYGDSYAHLAVGYYNPHPPMVAPGKYFKMHDPAKAPLAKLLENDREDIPDCAFYRPTDPAYNYLSDSLARSYIQARYAAVAYVDAQVGRVLKAWEEAGMGENSIIVFTGDQGFHLGEHGYWHKTSLFDAGLKVPLIIRGGNQQGVRNDISQLVDIYPTILGLIGLDPLSHLDGRDLFESPVSSDETYALSQVLTSGISIRTDRYRYNRWTEEGQVYEELYDYREDPNEFRNLVGNLESAEVRIRLSTKLDILRAN